MKRLSVNACAKITGLSRRQIMNAIERGEIKYLRIRAGVFRIASSDLNRWLSAKTVGGAACWEVFVPQTFTQSSFKRNDRALIIRHEDRKRSIVIENRYARPSSKTNPIGVMEDFRSAMEMPGSKPL